MVILSKMAVYYCSICFITLASGSTVVQYLTHNPKIKGSNPATGTGREKKYKK